MRDYVKREIQKGFSDVTQKIYENGWRGGYSEAYKKITGKEINDVATTEEWRDLWSDMNAKLVCGLPISVRSANVLSVNFITTIDVLCEHSVGDLLAMSGMGPKSVNEIREALGEHGLSLRGDRVVA